VPGLTGQFGHERRDDLANTIRCIHASPPRPS
jgi:hypothetical protein